MARLQRPNRGALMRAKNVQRIFCLVILFSFIVVSQAKAAEWIFFVSAKFGDSYYDKTTINKNGDTVSVWVKDIYSEDGKNKSFSIIKSLGYAPSNSDKLSYHQTLSEIDCISKRTRRMSMTIYDNNGSAIFSLPNGPYEWNYITPASAIDILKNIVCSGSR
jgi:hypothetical protein